MNPRSGGNIVKARACKPFTDSRLGSAGRIRAVDPVLEHDVPIRAWTQGLPGDLHLVCVGPIRSRYASGGIEIKGEVQADSWPCILDSLEVLAIGSPVQRIVEEVKTRQAGQAC